MLRFRLFNQICSHVILVQVDGVSNKANHDNKFFLSYLFASLHDVTLSIGNIFQVQWKANAISYQVLFFLISYYSLVHFFHKFNQLIDILLIHCFAAK